MNYKYIFLFLIGCFSAQKSVQAQVENTIEIKLDTRTAEEKYPEIFTSTQPNHPDTAYEIGKQLPGFENDFGGNEGKNQFYLVYAQHLQKLNLNDFAKEYRIKFQELYQSINRINGLIDNKTSYYTTMQTHLIAYAEFSLYEFSQIDQAKFETIDVPKQRKFFIKSILIKVKTKNQQLNLTSSPSFSKNQELIANEIKKIENLITDGYTLKVSQVFHYKYY